jgi:lipoprotein-anchoring transpeptidase ErfK/SrfK
MRTCTRSFLLAIAGAALLGVVQPAAADGYGPSQDLAPLQADADGLDLRAGQYRWLPGSEVRSDTPVTLLVNLGDQRAYVYRDGRRIAVTTVSTGKPGHDTPTGVFPIMGKERMHHSNRYDNAPMPWMQRLTRWGHALHAGNVRPFPASHGCVRLPAEFAKQLFSLTSTGDLVIISEDYSPRSVAIALAIAGRDNSTALAVGLTEPLPNIVFVKRGQATTGADAATVGAGSITAF